MGIFKVLVSPVPWVFKAKGDSKDTWNGFKEERNEIFDFLVDRYGDFILLNPPLKPSTYFLWYGPVIFLIIGVLMIIFIMKRRRRLPPEKPLSSEESLSLSKLLEQKDRN